MTPEQFELYYILQKQRIPFEEKVRAAQIIGREVLLRRIEQEDIPLFYPLAVDLWRSLGSNEAERNDLGLIDVRKKLANVCWRLSLQLPEGQKFFTYYPRVQRAEGFEERVTKKIKRGALKTVYGSSLYEFHREYPIEGFGIRKDLISVITDENEKIPIMDWCKQNEIVVYCNRCGLDITFEVSMDCPFMKARHQKRS
jgi:hypothetical protein